MHSVRKNRGLCVKQTPESCRPPVTAATTLGYQCITFISQNICKSRFMEEFFILNLTLWLHDVLSFYVTISSACVGGDAATFLAYKTFCRTTGMQRMFPPFLFLAPFPAVLSFFSRFPALLSLLPASSS